jgi:hypothetical protein
VAPVVVMRNLLLVIALLRNVGCRTCCTYGVVSVSQLLVFLLHFTVPLQSMDAMVNVPDAVDCTTDCNCI